jgi:hypothetical protein
MSEAVQRIKADDKVAGQPCGWCKAILAPGDDSALCSACGTAHHGTCWDNQLGCSKTDCLNAPLKRMDAAPAGTASTALEKKAPEGYKFCATCKNPMLTDAQVCDLCGAINTPDGIYHGPKENAPGAVASLVCGIIGLFFCGIVLGPLAIAQSNKAKATIRADPRYGGGGIATAGFVLGIVSLIGWGLVMVSRMAQLGR